jgi:hypothetical protein
MGSALPFRTALHPRLATAAASSPLAKRPLSGWYS